MAIDSISSIIASFPLELTPSLKILITIFQAVGGFIILYIIFNIVNTIISRKKNKEIKKISDNLEEIKKLLRRKNIKK